MAVVIGAWALSSMLSLPSSSQPSIISHGEDGTPGSPSRKRFSRPHSTLRRTLSRVSGFSFGGGETPSDFNPYDTTSLNIFIRETFPGALLLEEHQV